MSANIICDGDSQNVFTFENIIRKISYIVLLLIPQLYI